MNILIIGNGGREHAIAWKSAQSPLVEKIFVAPGNAGTQHEKKCQNIAIDATDISALLTFAQQNNIELTIVGPEAPLSLGIVDEFSKAGLACFGPSQAAAQLESSKAFSKAFMQRHQIPTAEFKTFINIDDAKKYLSTHALPVVIKADGLAAGKGVVIAHSLAEAHHALDAFMTNKSLGHAGNQIVIEEFLAGEEASFIVIADGETVLPLATSQDHKTRDDGDKGPNTGGMGAYSPAPVVTPELHERVIKEIIKPTLKGMLEDGIHYQGFLYAGLMIDKNGNPKVLEFNCRLGDPETQPIMMRCLDDLIPVYLAAIEHRLDSIKLTWDPRPALGVVLAASGYPDAYQKGLILPALPQTDNTTQKIFHAGTIIKDQKLLSNGGRLLCITALGENIAEARRAVYELIQKFDHKLWHYRHDIGYRALQREK